VTSFNGYPFSVMLAILIHGLIVGSLLILQRADSEVLNVIRPPAIKALLVQENPQARNEQVQQQRTQQQRQEQARQEQARQEQVTQEQVRQEQARQEQARQDQAAREQAAQQEEQRLTAVRQQRDREQQAEQQRQQEVARQQEAVRQQEQQRQQEAQRLEQQQQQENTAAAAAAAAAADAREVALTESEIAMAYMGVIHDLVQQNWSRPPSARNNMTAVLRIRLVPTGDVVDVEIVTSSGDAAFDRAAENAVRAVGRFSELQRMPPRMFDRNFRSLLLTFRPEDLLN
jgi:colicin import membrane protein